MFKDGDVILELECCHIEHDSCVSTRGSDPKCMACDHVIRKRW